nr:MAG TPA: hypothetical protein [Caudoviricetes sp.]
MELLCRRDFERYQGKHEPERNLEKISSKRFYVYSNVVS